MEPRRKTYLSEAGEPLLLNATAHMQAERWAEFSRDSGLEDHDILSSPLLSIPLPQKRHSAGVRGWPVELNPAVMWHPLFWLPERIAMRYRFEDPDMEPSEDDNEWAIRVAIETTISTLFDPTDGTWVDVLSLVGLDVEDAGVQQRLRIWLQGAPDGDLDSIDLSGMTELTENPHWALEEATEMLPTLLPAAWSLLADELAATLIEADAADLHRTVTTVAGLARGVLSDVPGFDDSQPAPDELFESVLAGVVAGADLTVMAEKLLFTLQGIQKSYYPMLAAVSFEVEQSNSLNAP
jgi:hypothetical protein